MTTPASTAACAANSAATTRPLLTRTWVVCLLAMVSCGLWGSAIPCIKIGYQLLGIESADVPSEFLFAGLRFMLAGVIAIAAASIAERRLVRVKRSSLGMVARLSLAQTIVQYAFFYVGVSHASGVKGTIVNASSTFLTILVATLVFRQERLTGRKLVGCLIGFAGVILIASLSYAVSSSLIRVYSQHENPVALSGYQFMLGGAVLAAAGLALGGHLSQVTPAGIGMLLYLACVSGIAYSLWSILLKYNPTSRVAIFGFMNPVFGVVLSSVLLGEAGTLPWQQTLIALVLITVGIVIVNRAPARKGA